YITENFDNTKPAVQQYTAALHTENCYVSDLNGYGISPTIGPFSGYDPVTGVANAPKTNLVNYVLHTYPNGTTEYWPTGVFANGGINPNGQILTGVYPLPNIDPTTLVNGQKLGYNYVNAQTRFSNMLQERGRVDYNFSDSMKLYVSYNHQHDNAVNSL